jgi:fibronectin type 3 domain-containing protein
VDKPEYVDTSTEYGKAYEYYVQGIHEKAESDAAGPATITPKDKFPPAVPSGLTASTGIGAIELAWDRNTESDFKDYQVYRSEENERFVKIAEGLEGPVYSDRKIESGKHYRYRITADDQTGNVSEPSQPVEIIAP